jgi:surfactin synthase thioesterase subunit
LFLLVLRSYFRRLFRLKRLATTPIDRGYYLTMLLSMGGMLFFGMSQQLHQNPAFFVTLAWVYGLRAPSAAAPVPAPGSDAVVPSPAAAPA